MFISSHAGMRQKDRHYILWLSLNLYGHFTKLLLLTQSIVVSSLHYDLSTMRVGSTFLQINICSQEEASAQDPAGGWGETECN